MREQNSYDPTELMDHINSVDAPPFLLTRIRQRAQEAYEQKVSPAFAWVSACVLVLVFSLNAYVISEEPLSGRSDHEAHAASNTAFFPDNSLYE